MVANRVRGVVFVIFTFANFPARAFGALNTTM